MFRIFIIILNFALILAMLPNSPTSSTQQPKRPSSLNPDALVFNPARRQYPLPQNPPGFSQQLPNQDYARSQFTSHQMHHLPLGFEGTSSFSPTDPAQIYAFQHFSPQVIAEPEKGLSNLTVDPVDLLPKDPFDQNAPLIQREAYSTISLPEQQQQSTTFNSGTQSAVEDLQKSPSYTSSLLSTSKGQQKSAKNEEQKKKEPAESTSPSSANIYSHPLKDVQISDEVKERAKQQIEDLRRQHGVEEILKQPVLSPIGSLVGYKYKGEKSDGEKDEDGGEKSSLSTANIMQSPIGGSDSDLEKGIKKISPKAMDRNEGELAADQLMKNVLKDSDRQSLEGKKPTEEPQKKSDDSPKTGHAIKTTSKKEEKPTEIMFGSLGSVLGSGLVGIVGHQTAAQIEQTMDQPFVEKNKQKETLPDVDQKEVKHPHQQQQSSSSSIGKVIRKPMNIDEKETKPSIQVPTERRAQDQRHQAIEPWKEQQRSQQNSPPLVRKSPRVKTLKRRGGHAQWLPKKNSPSSSPTASSPLASSSPLSAASSVPTSPSVASSHSTPPSGSIKSMESSSKVLENKFDLLAKEAESQETEDEIVSEEEGSGKNEIHQESIASKKSAKSSNKKKKAVTIGTGSSSGGKVVKIKTKEEDAEEMKFLDTQVKEVAKERELREQERRQLIEQLSKRVLNEQEEERIQQRQSEKSKNPEKETKSSKSGGKQKADKSSPKSRVSSSGRQDDTNSLTKKMEVEQQMGSSIIVQINHMIETKRNCERLHKADVKEKGKELLELKDSYIDLMKMLDEFEAESPFTRFEDILKLPLFEVTSSDGQSGKEDLINGVLDCLVYLDRNVGMTHLKEQGIQLTVFDKLFEDIFELDKLIENYKNIKKAKDDKIGAKKAAALKKLEDHYEQNVENELYEAIDYLYLDVKRNHREIGQAASDISLKSQVRKKIRKEAASSGSQDATEMAAERMAPLIEKQLKHMNATKRKCEGLDNADEKEKELHELKSSYQDLMKLLEKFAMEIGDNYGRILSQYIHFDKVIKLFEGKGDKWEEKVINFVLDCLSYLDRNGDMAHLKEQGRQLTVFDKLIKNILTLDGLVIKYEQVKNKGKDDKSIAIALENLKYHYTRHVHNELSEAIGYLYLGVTKQPWKIDEAASCLEKFASVLPMREFLITISVEIIRKLSKLQMFQDPGNMVSSVDKSLSSKTQVPKRIDNEAANSSVRQEDTDFAVKMTVQINLMQEIKLKCGELDNADEKEKKLHKLKNTYLDFMKLLEDIAREFEDKYEKPLFPFIRFDEILKLLEIKLPDGEDGEEMMIDIVLDSLVYMDMNGGMIHLKEQGREITVFDQLLKNILTMDGLIKEVKDDKGSSQKSIKKLEDYYEQNVESILYEAIGYMYVGVTRNREEIGQMASCLKEFALVLPNRQERIMISVHILGEMSELPIFKLSENTDPIEVTIPLSKLGQHIQPISALGAVSSGSSSSHQVRPSNIIGSFKLPKTPEERAETMKLALRNLIGLIVANVKLLQAINNTCMINNRLPSQSELEKLGQTYKAVMDLLENFTDIYGDEYKWDGKTHYTDIFKWICTTFNSIEGLELPDSGSLVDIMSKSKALLHIESDIERLLAKINQLKTINNNCKNPEGRQIELKLLDNTYKDVMELLKNFTNTYGAGYKWDEKTHFADIFEWICTTFNGIEGLELPDSKSLMHIISMSTALLYMQNPTKIAQLLKNVDELNTKVDKYNNAGDDDRSLKFKLMETHYKLLVDPNMREFFSLQFIGMHETIVPAIQRVERMRKSVLQKGLILLAAAVSELHQEPLKQVQPILERFFDTWTAGLETEIRANLPRYTAKIMASKEQNVRTMERLEQIADEYIRRTALYERETEKPVFGSRLEAGMTAIGQLYQLKELGSSKEQPITGSSKKSNKKAARAKDKVGKKEADEAEGLINRFNWEPVLVDIQKLIRYILLLSLMQTEEGKLNTKFDGLHVHVRVWTILYENTISPIIEEWDHNLVKKKQPKEQKEYNIQEVLEFLSEEMVNFLSKNSQAEKGEQIKGTMEHLMTVIIDQKYPMRHRYKHLKRSLANYDAKKDADADHFQTCNMFDHLLQD